MRTKETLLFFGFLAFCVLANAQNIYYVDGNKTTPGTGTQSDPYPLISQAINWPVRDTTQEKIIYLKAGTYSIDTLDNFKQIYFGELTGGGGGHFVTLQPMPGDEGKVIIDGSQYLNFCPGLVLVGSGARYVRLKGLIFRNLKNINASAVSMASAQHIEINECRFDSLLWTTDADEYGYAVSGNKRVNAIRIQNCSNISVTNDTLSNSALGWGQFLLDAGGNSAFSTTGFVSVATVGLSTNYYVATNGDDNTGTGSIVRPWKTINKAFQGGMNYDVVPAVAFPQPRNIILRGGTYYPVNSISIGSTFTFENSPLTISSYPGEKAILDGSQLTAKFSAFFGIEDAQNVTIRELKLQNLLVDSTLVNAAPSVGIKDTRFGISVRGVSKNIHIVKNEITGIKWTTDTAKMKAPQPNDVAGGITVLGNKNSPMKYIYIDSNKVHHNIPGFAEAVTVNGYVDSFYIRGNEVYYNENIGIVAAGHYRWVTEDPNNTVTRENNYSRHGWILGNTVYGNISPVAVSAGIYLDGSRYVHVENNLSYHNGTGMSIGNEQDSSESGYHVVQMNVFKENIDKGFYYGSNHNSSIVKECLVRWNTIKDNWYDEPELQSRVGLGFDTASQQYYYLYGVRSPGYHGAEMQISRIRDCQFKENTILSDHNTIIQFGYNQYGNNQFQYNEYYVQSEDACQAIFEKDLEAMDGNIDTLPVSYSSFHAYVQGMGYDSTSTCEGASFDPDGCGTVRAAIIAAPGFTNTIARENALYPNPARDNISLRLTLEKPGPVNIRISDFSGRVIATRNYNLQAGTQVLNLSDLRRSIKSYGLYLVQLRTQSYNQEFKLLIQ